MTVPTDFDRVLAAWLDVGGPGHMPGALVRDAVADARTRRRRRPSRVWRWHVPRLGRYPLGIVAIGVTAALIAGLIAGLAGVGQHPSPISADRGVFRRTGSPLSPRGFESATTLLDGRVLVVGGYAGFAGTVVDTAELWDPDTGLFTFAGDTIDHRDGHSAALLQDGRVLIIGGFGSGGEMTSAEIWDPRSMTFSPTGSLAVGRAPRYAGATWLLPDGRVLVVGGMAADGSVVTTPEVWDPRTDTFGPADALPASHRPAGVLLADGSVLVVDADGARTWDPTTGAFTPAGTPGVLRDTTQNATATLLQDGRVLVAGGSADVGYLASAEIWDPADRRFDPTGAMTVGRAYAAAALLHDGRVVVVGGRGGFDSAEVFGFEDAPTASPSGRAVPSADQ